MVSCWAGSRIKMHLLTIGVAFASTALAAAPSAAHPAASSHTTASWPASAHSPNGPAASASAILPVVVRAARLLQFLGGVIALIQIEPPGSCQYLGARNIRPRRSGLHCRGRSIL